MRMLVAMAALMLPVALCAQEMDHGGHSMPGMTPPASADPHAGHHMPAMEAGGEGTMMLSTGNVDAPPSAAAWAADAVYDPADMARARRETRTEHGGMLFSQVIFNLAEYQLRGGRDGYRWDGEGWFGGDIDRLVVKTQGEGQFGQAVESAEVQALYSRAVGPYFNVQAGLRHDFAPGPSLTYASIGFEGLAPYMFDVEGAVFLSTKGDVLGRLEGYYDQRLTQRLILQPRVEVNMAAQDVPDTRTGSGVSDIELGLRLRYEMAREFAPYVGVAHDRKLGDTARYARLDGKDTGATSLVLGVRTWF